MTPHTDDLATAYGSTVEVNALRATLSREDVQQIADGILQLLSTMDGTAAVDRIWQRHADQMRALAALLPPVAAPTAPFSAVYIADSDAQAARARRDEDGVA